MYYIANSHVQFVGFKKLPYAIFNYKTGKTEFLNKEQFLLLFQCDGHHDIDMEQMTEKERSFFSGLIEKEFISECEKGTELKPYQEYHFYDNRFKNTVHWSITGRCNYRCKHCFMSAPDAKYGHASLDQCLKLIEEMEECGIREVSLTGGEPLVRDDFFEIVKALTAHHIRISSILTNGALVNDALLDGLEANHQHPSFQMSYDGVGTHDWMRGITGAEKKVLDAFRLLQKRGYSTSSAMVLCKRNVDTIRESVLQLKEVGCGSLKINVAYPSGEWVKHPDEFLTQAEGYQAFLDYIPQYFADGAPIGIMLEGTFNYEPQEKRSIIIADKNCSDFKHAPVCGQLRSMIYVGPEGNVLPCQSMINAPLFKKYPNVFESSLKEVLSESSYIDDVGSNVIDIMNHNEECAQCEYKTHCCGGCRAMAVGANGDDFLAPDRNVCRFYKDGWYQKFKELAARYS